jgi:hypothetical protein
MKEEEEFKNCSFKPDLSQTAYFYNKQNKAEEVEVKNGNGKRVEQLYHIGTKKRKEKKNIERNDYEYMKYEKECTFNPIIEKKSVEDLEQFDHDIYNDKSYMLYYDRIKKGIAERYLKNSIHERGTIPKEFVDELNKPKPDVSQISMKMISSSKSPIKPKGNTSSEGNVHKEEVGSSFVNNDGKDKEGDINDKKDEIPLLIIDVNIRPGVKKKINVYDGDTAEALATKFAKEHNLDRKTEVTLTQLIQSHMSKLLMRIDEENQSVSEKSSLNKH